MTSTNKDSSRESLEAENARLRARVRELESRSSEGRTDATGGSARWHRWEEAEDRVRAIPDHAFDTVNRLARGLASAHAEYLQASLDATNAFLDDIVARSRTGRKASSTSEDAVESSRELAADVASGIVECIHQSLETPLRAVDRFFDAYFEEGEAGRRHNAEPRRVRRHVRTAHEGRPSTGAGETEQVSSTAT
jgi:predicted metal-dependent phosphoesterase TrpH